VAATQRPIGGAPFDSLAVALAFGVALLIVVAGLGHITGGHVNPAVTVGLAATGRFPWQSVPLYLGAQFAGPCWPGSPSGSASKGARPSHARRANGR
jgi:glycerol uptake facilitator-like aquaporin